MLDGIDPHLMTSTTAIPPIPIGIPRSSPSYLRLLNVNQNIRVASNKPRYKGPVYHPMHIYDMLSEEVKKELEKILSGKEGQLSAQ